MEPTKSVNRADENREIEKILEPLRALQGRLAKHIVFEKKEISVIFDYHRGIADIAIDGQLIERKLVDSPSRASSWIGAQYIRHCDRIFKVLKMHGNVEAKYNG